MKLSLCAFLLYAGAAAAQERFGQKGTISPSGSVGASYSTTPSGVGDFTTYGFSLDPGALFFVVDEVAIGGSVHFARAWFEFPGSPDRSALSAYGIGPTVGWNIWLGEHVSLFPQGTLRVSWQTSTGSDTTERVITVQAFAPAILHVAPHFFLGLGPTVSRDIDSTFRVGIISPGGSTVVSSPKTTTIGLQSVIGGWF
jgi:hypothetical protein